MENVQVVKSYVMFRFQQLVALFVVLRHTELLSRITQIVSDVPHHRHGRAARLCASNRPRHGAPRDQGHHAQVYVYSLIKRYAITHTLELIVAFQGIWRRGIFWLARGAC